MSTILFDQIVFGPIKSRRLGQSLGINLLPLTSKRCNFNCIYCECGWNAEQPSQGVPFFAKDTIIDAIENRLIELKTTHNLPDVLTFAGNGEPTMHPDFEAIIDAVIELRNKYMPKTKIGVLSNATLIQKASVYKALRKIELPMLKLDSAIQKTVQLINQPQGKFSITNTIEQLLTFNGQLTIQTMFFKGMYKGQIVDNTTAEELKAWLDALKLIQPQQVSIYTIDRNTPAPDLYKLTPEALEQIADQARQLGCVVQVSA